MTIDGIMYQPACHSTPPHCAKCGCAVRMNVPRLGWDAGSVHADTGLLECGNPNPTAVTTYQSLNHMKTITLTLAALAALSSSGCLSLNEKLAGLQGFTVGTVQESRKDPFGGGSFNAEGVATDPKTGVTTINSASVQETYPMWSWSLSTTGVVLVPKTSSVARAVPAAVK